MNTNGAPNSCPLSSKLGCVWTKEYTETKLSQFNSPEVPKNDTLDRIKEIRKQQTEMLQKFAKEKIKKMQGSVMGRINKNWKDFAFDNKYYDNVEKFMKNE